MTFEGISLYALSRTWNIQTDMIFPNKHKRPSSSFFSSFSTIQTITVYVHTDCCLRFSDFFAVRPPLVVVYDKKWRSPLSVLIDKLSFVFSQFTVFHKSSIANYFLSSQSSSLTTCSQAFRSSSWMNSFFIGNGPVPLSLFNRVIPMFLKHAYNTKFFQALIRGIVSLAWYKLL